jgi:hypothetical protein
MAWYGYEDYKDTIAITIGPFLEEFGKVIFLGLYKPLPNRIAGTLL